MMGEYMEKFYRENVHVYNEIMLVDTKTGEGITRVLKKIDPLLCKMSCKFYISGHSFDDLKQELTIMAIEGIRSYNPSKETKLSTFLQTHLTNKLISRIKSQNKMSKNAFALSKDKSENDEKYFKAHDEVSFTQCNYLLNKDSGEDSILFENNIAEDGKLFNGVKKDYNSVDFEISFKKILESLDDKTAKILELIYYKDYSLSDAAAAVDLTHWAAVVRLKKLAEKKYMQEIFYKVE